METSSSIRIRTASSRTSIIKSETIKKEELMSRSEFLDITNDSPIVGLAMESLSGKTSSSSFVENRGWVVKNISGSREDLLQKVEEEVKFVNNKISSGDLIAPTFVNIPPVKILEENGTKNAPIQIAEDVKPEEETLNPQDCLINRAMLFDSPDNSSITSSYLAYQGSETQKSPEFDSSSAWPLQVNVSVQNGVEVEDEIEEEELEEYKDEKLDEEDHEDGPFDELCEGLNKMSVQEEFIGKHTRFIYNSDDEIEAGVIVSKKNVSPNVVVLKGLPVPEGKHLRFQDEDQE